MALRDFAHGSQSRVQTHRKCRFAYQSYLFLHNFELKLLAIGEVSCCVGKDEPLVV